MEAKQLRCMTINKYLRKKIYLIWLLHNNEQKNDQKEDESILKLQGKRDFQAEGKIGKHVENMSKGRVM